MYIGLDIGTSSVKAILFSETGKVLCKCTKSYAIKNNVSEKSELDPIDVRKTVIETLRYLAKSGYEVKTIGISSLGEACVLTDENDNILSNTILPGDIRGAEFLDEINDYRNEYFLEYTTALPVNSTYTLPKLLWIKKYEPLIFQKIKHIMLYGDYIGHYLSGERKISFSLASRTQLFDINKKIFSSDILHRFNLDKAFFSTPNPATEILGVIRPDIANKTGLPYNVKIYIGGHDQPCAALGAGCLFKGQAVDTTGTSECITPIIGNKPFSPEFIKRTNLCSEPSVIPGVYNTLAYTHTAGRLLEWYLNTILCRSSYEEMEKQCKLEPTGLLIMPHFSGAGTPTMDHKSVGTITGLSLNTTDVDIYQALMEGITYEMRVNLELLRECNITPTEVSVVGGGVKSYKWLFYKANILQIPVKILHCEEASSLGAAMSSAVGHGCFANFEQAVSGMVSVDKIIYPEDKTEKKYSEIYIDYCKLYENIKNTIRR